MIVDSKATIKARRLKFIRADEIRAGISQPNIGPGTQIDFIVDSASQSESLLQSKIKSDVETSSPSQLKSQALDTYLGDFDFPRKQASQATGTVVYKGAFATTITNSNLALDASGRSYAVVSPGYMAPGAILTIAATTGGRSTGLPAGATLTWQIAPAGASGALVVNTAIEGGVDVESDSDYWARWQNFVQGAISGSSADQVNWSLKVHPQVQQGFVYPCANGPATMHIALLAKQSQSPTGSRVVPQNVIAACQQAHALADNSSLNTLIQSVVDNPLNVMVQLDSRNWLAQYPIPTNAGATQYPIILSGMSSGVSVSFLCDYNLLTYTQYAGAQPSLPFSGTLVLSNPVPIQWIAPNGNVVSSSIVAITAVSVSGSQYKATVTLSAPLSTTDSSTGIVYTAASGSWIMPALSNAQDVVNVIWAQLAKLCPGEKFNTTNLRYLRFPFVGAQNPNALTSALTGALTALDGVRSAAVPFLFDLVQGVQVQLDVGPQYSTASQAVTAGPYVFVPQNLGFYPINGVNK